MSDQDNAVVKAIKQAREYTDTKLDDFNNYKNDIKEQIHTQIGPFLNDFNVWRHDTGTQYEANMDPKTLEHRRFYVWAATFGVLGLTFMRTWNPRRLIRNPFLVYTIGSIAICRENFNPLK